MDGATLRTVLRWFPLTVPLARAMLEPALNLARLRIRAGAHDEALHLLGDIYQAATSAPATRARQERQTAPLLPVPASP